MLDGHCRHRPMPPLSEGQPNCIREYLQRSSTYSATAHICPARIALEPPPACPGLVLLLTGAAYLEKEVMQMYPRRGTTKPPCCFGAQARSQPHPTHIYFSYHYFTVISENSGHSLPTTTPAGYCVRLTTSLYLGLFLYLCAAPLAAAACFLFH